MARTPAVQPLVRNLMGWAPFLQWLPAYRRADLRGDLTAGVTTAVMLVPQAMAYALLAGLPPIIGLYAAVVPLAVYALFGSSRQLAVGPVAMVSLLVATGVGPVAPAGSLLYVAYAVLLSAMVGALQFGMGVARLGFLVNFLSHPVISGFTSAAALIIGASQLKHLLGLPLPRGAPLHELLGTALRSLPQVHMPTLALGLGSVLLLVLLKRWRPMFPGALTVVLLGSLTVWGLGLDAAGVAIVGTVPAGLPDWQLPALEWSAAAALLPTALTIALVGFMESISVAKVYARRNRYELNPNQELVGLGLANLAGSVFQAYPVTGGFSRTAVNASAGARTGLASLITAGLVALTLLFLTPLFTYLPRAVLAAIIVTAVVNLIDWREVRHLWHVKRSDLALLALTFAATLSIGIEQGIATGVGASLLWHFLRTTRPHLAVLGRLPGTEVYRNLRRHPEALTLSGVLILRFDAQFYFGNVSFVKDALNALRAAAPEPVRTVILDASSVNNLDSSAASALHDIAADLRDAHCRLILAGVKGPVRDVMERDGVAALLGPGAFSYTVHEAVALHLAAQDSPAGQQELALEPSAPTARRSAA